VTGAPTHSYQSKGGCLQLLENLAPVPATLDLSGGYWPLSWGAHLENAT